MQMKLELKNEKVNPYMKRRELHIHIEHEGEATPTKAALQQLAAKQFGFEADKTDVRSIFSASGSPCSEAKVFVWTGEVKKEPKS